LKAPAYTKETRFRLFLDLDIGISNLEYFVESGSDEPIIDSYQDDDVESDEDVRFAGTN